MSLAQADAVRRVSEAWADSLALGHEVVEGPGARVVRCDAAPRIYDANHLQLVRTRDPGEVAEALALADRVLGDRGYRHVLSDPLTPPAVSAELALRGYRPQPTLQLLLEGPLGGPAPAPAEIRTVESEGDWEALRQLMAADHAEAREVGADRRMDEDVSREMWATRRLKAPALRFFLARRAGRDAAYFSAWPGGEGVGMVEDLFTRPDARGHGLARALLHAAVADARARGAGPVLIGADPADWPRRFYAACGFRPVCVTWSWLWLAESPGQPAAPRYSPRKDWRQSA